MRLKAGSFISCKIHSVLTVYDRLNGHINDFQFAIQILILPKPGNEFLYLPRGGSV